MILALLLGLLLGAGLWFLAVELVVPRARLASSVAALQGRRSMPVVNPSGGASRASVTRDRAGAQFKARVADSAVITRLFGEELNADLRLLGIDRGDFWTRRVVSVLAALVIVPIPLTAFAVAIQVPLVACVPVVVVVAVLAAFIPIAGVRRRAAVRRFEALSSLSAYVGLVGALVAGGVGAPQALLLAADIGDGAIWRRLRALLRSGPVRHETPAKALVRLDRQLRIPEVGELGSQIDRAMREGHPVADSLQQRSKALRGRVVDETLGEGSQRAGGMTLAMTIFAAAHFLVLMYVGVESMFP